MAATCWSVSMRKSGAKVASGNISFWACSTLRYTTAYAGETMARLATGSRMKRLCIRRTSRVIAKLQPDANTLEIACVVPSADYEVRLRIGEVARPRQLIEKRQCAEDMF